jgi:hypothetical protein
MLTKVTAVGAWRLRCASGERRTCCWASAPTWTSLPEALTSTMLPLSREPRPRRTVTLPRWPWPNCLSALRGSTTWSCSTVRQGMSRCRLQQWLPPGTPWYR